MSLGPWTEAVHQGNERQKRAGRSARWACRLIALLIVVSHVGSPVSTAQGLHEFGPVDEAVWDGSVEMGEESSLPEPPPAAPLSQVPLVPGPVDESVSDPIEEPQPVEQE